MRFFQLSVRAALALVFLLAASDRAWALVCTAPDRVDVNVQLQDPGAKVTSASSLSQINSKAQAHGLHRRGKMVLGLTQSQVVVGVNFETSVMYQGDNYCVNVTRLDATFGHKDLTVILPREYARGTCQYKEVLKHEMEHVRVNREGVRKYAMLLERKFKQTIARLNPVGARSERRAMAVLKSELNKVKQKALDDFRQETERQHAVIDKPGGPYDATGLCRSW